MDVAQAQAILELTHSAFVSMDEAGRITYWNARAEEMFGFARDEVLDCDLADTIIPEQHRAAHREGLDRFKTTGEGRMLDRPAELGALRADGVEVPVELTISALPDGGGWSFHAFLADISDRRAAERERQHLLDELTQALHGSEQRLAVTLDALAEAVTIRAPDDQLIYANQAALARLELQSVQELRDADPRALMNDWETSGERGEPISMDDLPSVRLLRGEQPEPLMLRAVNRTTGREQWSLLKAAAVRDERGSIEAAVTIIEDMTTAKRNALRTEYMARASQVLASSLDYQQTLRNVAGLAVPQIADWCAVDLFDEEGGREPVAVAHADPTKVELAERLRAREPGELNPGQGVGRVRETGEPLLVSDISDELLAAVAIDEEHLRLLRAVGIRSVLIVPLKIRDEAIGALTLVSAESGRAFDDSDVQFAEQIAERAARAAENARLYTERSEVARTLQRSLLPEAVPEVAGWEISTLYRPAGHGNEVGGDFYDFWEVDGAWLVMIGDVTGKGVGAAAVTSLVRHTARTASEFDSRPAQVLARVDAALKRSPTLSVCTAICLRLSEDGGTIAVGGHPLPLRLSAAGLIEIGRPGALLGAFAGMCVNESSFSMQPGETIVIITDGVTDAIGAGGERFGVERLRTVLGEVRDAAPRVVRQRLVSALEEFQVGAQADDTAAIVMRFHGRATNDEPDRDDEELASANLGIGS
jgi:PAS domain S-box-containing protein